MERGYERLGVVLKRTELIEKALKGELRWVDVAEALRLTPRQVRRLKKRFSDKGAEGLLDYRRLSRPRNSKPKAVVDRVLELFRGPYREWNVKHFWEKLTEAHGVHVSYPWVLQTLRKAGLIAHKLKSGPPRQRRERRPMTGMLLQIDGSEHHWLGPDLPAFTLVAVIDDATNQVYSAVFSEQEDLKSVFFVIRETIEKKGIFCALYSDRASHFFFTPKAGGKVDLNQRTQCQMALEQLGIEMIPAYSPEAKGRIERLWGTFQGRLPQELKLAGVTDIAAANRYLREIFVADCNRRFSIKPREKTSAFVKLHPSIKLDQIFAVRTKRVVQFDNTVAYRNRTLQIPANDHRISYAKIIVTVLEHMDGTLSILHGPKVLGRFSETGELMEKNKAPMRKTGS